VIVGALVELSLILMASTMFPSIDVTRLFVELTVVFAVALIAMAIFAARNRGGSANVEVEKVSKERRAGWTMPPLALLERPVWSPGRRAGMLLLRGYLVVAVLLLVVKSVQLGH